MRFELPDGLPYGWTYRLLATVCSRITSGGTPSRRVKEYFGGNVNWVKTQELLDRKLVDTEEKITVSGLNNSSAKLLPENTVLLAMYGATVGKLGILEKESTCNQACCAFICDPKQSDYRFLFYVLLGNRTNIIGLASGAAQQNLSGQQLKLVELAFPPLALQKNIANVLASIDDRIDHNRVLAANLEAIARQLFKSWFVDFDPVRAKAAGEKPTSLADDIAVLFPDRFVDSEIGEVPEGWGYRSLAAVASLNPDAWTTRKHPDSVNYIDLSNVKNGLIEIATKYMWESAPSRARRVLRIGDTIVGTVRPGNCSFAFVDHDGLTGSTGFAVLRPTRKTYREFLYFAATSDDAIDRLAHFADGAAYPAVRSDVVLATEIAIPSDAVMNKFSEVTRRVIDRASVCKREAVVLAHIRDILLPRLISGEIRVSDAHKQIEEALG